MIKIHAWYGCALIWAVLQLLVTINLCQVYRSGPHPQYREAWYGGRGDYGRGVPRRGSYGQERSLRRRVPWQKRAEEPQTIVQGTHHLACYWCLHRHPICVNKPINETCHNSDMTVFDRHVQATACVAFGFCKPEDKIECFCCKMGHGERGDCCNDPKYKKCPKKDTDKCRFPDEVNLCPDFNLHKLARDDRCSLFRRRSKYIGDSYEH